MKRTKAGGKRKGAGRKKSAPKHIHQFPLENVLFTSLKSKIGTKILNKMLIEFCKELEKNYGI